MKMRDKARRVRNAMVGNNRILAALARRRPHVTSSSVAASTRSLYAVLMLGLFFALMLLVQMMSLVHNDTTGNLWLTNDDNNIDDDAEPTTEPAEPLATQNSNFFNRFLGHADNDRQMALPQQIAKQLERMLSGTYGSDSSKERELTKEQQMNATIRTMSRHLSNLTQFTVKDRWQPVNSSQDKFFVFSAFYDARHAKYRYVRVIAAARTRNAEKCVCRLHYRRPFKNGLNTITVNAVNKVIRENWNLKYSAYFVLCLLGNNPVPDTVSVLAKANGNSATNQLVVHTHPLMIAPKLRRRAAHSSPQQLLSNNSFAVCVKPLHYDYNKVLRLVEFFGKSHSKQPSSFVAPRTQLMRYFCIRAESRARRVSLHPLQPFDRPRSELSDSRLRRSRFGERSAVAFGHPIAKRDPHGRTVRRA